MSSSNGEITPKLPDMVAKVEWVRRYGKEHWGVIACAFLVVFVGWIVSTTWALGFLQNITGTLVDSRITKTVKDLRIVYPLARDSLNHGSGDFNDVEKDIDVILKLDPRNGTGLYYAGEVKRVRYKSLFTPKSCVIPERLASKPESLETYENEFKRYLDIEKAIPDRERSGNYSAESCYERPSGYCPQRTAWVHHLLANDFYEEAKLIVNSKDRADKLRRALEHAKAAADIYKDEHGQPGFEQCKATNVLIFETNKMLTSLTK